MDNEFWAGFSEATVSRARRPVVKPPAAKPYKKVARATRLKRAIYHTGNYARDNSDIGLRGAAKKKRWIDRDVQVTKDGHLIGTHWGNTARDRFYLDGKPVKVPFSKLTLAQVKRLRTKGGLKIDDTEHALDYGQKVGVPGIEFELKGNKASQRAINKLAADARREWGKGWQNRVQVKSFNPAVLLKAKRAGFKTTLIGYNGDPNDLPDWINTYRPGHKR